MNSRELRTGIETINFIRGTKMGLKLMLVKGFRDDFTEEKDLRAMIRTQIQNYINEYYPEVKIQDTKIEDIKTLIDNIITHLQVFQNLPIMIAVRKVGELIDYQINNFFKMCITDLGIICGDRIVKSVMVLEYYEQRENKDSK